MTPALRTQYNKTVVPALKEKFGYENAMEVPKLEKVVINVGYGRKHKDKTYIETVDETLTRISGQKPVHNKVSKSISNFKIREGVAVGASVTLRGDRMYEFLYKLIHTALPRVRDFRGISPKSFDRQGNYSLGLKESVAFPEANAETLEKIHPLQVVITTTASNRDEGRALLQELGFPFRDK